MADVSEAVHQDELADGLLGVGPMAAPLVVVQEESEYATPGGALVDEEIDDRVNDVFKFGDAEAARRHNEPEPAEPEYTREELAVLSQDERIQRGLDKTGATREQREQWDAMQERIGKRLGQEQPKTGGKQAHQAEAEQVQAPTRESVQAGIEALETTVEQHQLSDPQSAKGFADEFCAALGTDIYKAGVDVQTLGSTIAKTALSALDVYERFKGSDEPMPAIPAESARAFSFDVLKGLGIDPRTVDVDEQLLSQTVLGGMLNFYSTFEQYGGKVNDLAKLNHPQAAELFLGNFMKALGSDQPVNRQTAIKVADALGNYLLGFIDKVSAANQRQAEARQGQGGKSNNSGRGRGQRIPKRFQEGMKGSKAPRMGSNQDIFSPAVLQGALTEKL